MKPHKKIAPTIGLLYTSGISAPKFGDPLGEKVGSLWDSKLKKKKKEDDVSARNKQTKTMFPKKDDFDDQNKEDTLQRAKPHWKKIQKFKRNRCLK